MSTPRVIPHSEEAEGYLLSCILIDGMQTLIACVNAGMKSSVFYVVANRLIFERLMAMMAEGKPIELVTLSQELTMAKELQQVGGYGYLMQISGLIPTTAQAAFFIEKLMELYALRTTIHHATALVENCYAYSGQGLPKLIEPAITKLMDCVNGGQSRAAQDLNSVVDDAERQVESIINHKGPDPKRCLDWPLDDMNTLFYPPERGQLVMLSGPPSSGKSSIARQMVVKTSDDNRGSIYVVTLEVKPARLLMNIAQTLTRISIKELGATDPKSQQEFLAIVREMRRRRLYVSSTDRSLSQIVARARALHAADPLALIVVDHGLLMADIVDCPAGEREPVITKITGTFKALAQELDCVFLLLWQLVGSALKQGHSFKSSDMKGSNSLETDADKIIMVERPEQNPLTKETQSSNTHVKDMPAYYQLLIQTKGRDDGTATLGVEFARSIATFRPIVDVKAPPKQESIPFSPF